MASSFVGKVFTVTGGASGMGLATCRMLARRNVKAISIADFNDSNFSKVKAELEKLGDGKTSIDLVKVDVSSSKEVASWIDGVFERYGSLDGSVNAAGVPQAVGARTTKANILAETDETWRRTMGVNLDGVMFCNREQIRVMLNSPKSDLPRAIVNISSMAALLHGGDCFAYGASKTACASLSTSIANDVFKHGIRVNAILPGMTETPMLGQFFDSTKASENSVAANFALIQADDIANAAAYLLDSVASPQVIGANLCVGVGAP